jgi:hypothetical protein
MWYSIEFAVEGSAIFIATWFFLLLLCIIGNFFLTLCFFH